MSNITNKKKYNICLTNKFSQCLKIDGENKFVFQKQYSFYEIFPKKEIAIKMVTCDEEQCRVLK